MHNGILLLKYRYIQSKSHSCHANNCDILWNSIHNIDTEYRLHIYIQDRNRDKYTSCIHFILFSFAAFNRFCLFVNISILSICPSIADITLMKYVWLLDCFPWCILLYWNTSNLIHIIVFYHVDISVCLCLN